MPVATGSEARTIERLHAALAFAGVGAWEWDLRTGEAWWSDHLYALLGRVPKSIPTTLAGFLECMADEDREPFSAALRAVLQTGSTQAFSCRLVRPDGSTCLCRGQMGTLPDESGRSRLILGALRDTTVEGAGRRPPDEMLVRALREERSELRLMLDASPVPLVLVDAAQRILRVNYAAEGLFGWRAGDLTGRGLDTLLEDAPAMLDALLLAATARGPMERVTRPVPVVSRDGWPFQAEMTVVGAPAVEGARFVVAFSTERRPSAPPSPSPSSPWDVLNAARVDAPPVHR